jgi:hypothetical protein
MRWHIDLALLQGERLGARFWLCRKLILGYFFPAADFTLINKPFIVFNVQKND